MTTHLWPCLPSGSPMTLEPPEATSSSRSTLNLLAYSSCSLDELARSARFRPIALASLTTVCVMISGPGRGGAERSPMATFAVVMHMLTAFETTDAAAR